MAKANLPFEPFTFAADDPLAAEHAVVRQWVEDAYKADKNRYGDVDLKKVPSGQTILAAKPDQGRRYFLAALAQARYWSAQLKRVQAQGKNEAERNNPSALAGWDDVWNRRRQAIAVIGALTRRSLPLEKDDLLTLMDWCSGDGHFSPYTMPLANITRAAERYAEDHPITPEMHKSFLGFAARLRQAYDKNTKRLGTTIEQLCTRGTSEPQQAQADQPTPADVRPVRPAPAGHPAVLHPLKAYFGIAAEGAEPTPTESTAPDRHALRADSPLKAAHQLLNEVFAEVTDSPAWRDPNLGKTKTGRKILALDTAARGLVLLAAAERTVAGLLGRLDVGDPAAWRGYQAYYAASHMVASLATMPFEADRDGLFDLLLFVSQHSAGFADAMPRLLEMAERNASSSPLTEGERFILHLLRTSLIAGPPLGLPSDEVTRLTRLIGDGAMFYLVPGEAWSEAVNADITQMPASQRAKWVELFKHLLTATAARPSDRWLKSAAKLADAIAQDDLTTALLKWLPLVSKGRTLARLGAWHGDSRGAADLIHEENAICLRGLLWLIPSLKRKTELCRAATQVAISAYKKVPGVGPRAVKVGNAAVYALSEMAFPDAVGQLAMLKVRVKFGTAQKEIEKAFNTAAEALGLPRDQIEEMGVPSYGLEEVGRRTESFGEEFTAELRINGRDVGISWLRADGKPQKSIPAKVKSEFKEELKELQSAAKDIAAMLPAQAERIDSMFLLQKRWPIATWRERYLDHPLIGTIARRLIWNFRHAGRQFAGIWHDGRIIDADDKPLDLPQEAEVELWHPIDRPMDEVLAWRTWLEGDEVRQPFKQAHREVYLLTDAERRTHTYSNRFAAHILRQHQFHALCAARGWKNRLRLMVDDTYPPASRELPNWSLRAEFWIEGIGEDYGGDTTDSGAYLRLSTDQVRFYRIAAAMNTAHAGGGGYTTNAAGPGQANINEPLPLDQVPPLVFSEIMRDVDLFVGVASVGNDPTWQDGGPQGRYRDYWQSYSFGELSGTAQTRRAVLQSLLPRLSAIRERCSLDDRFLIVRGDLRTYKIHLGSGNILMLPNDEYLCIVPNRSTDGQADVFLPFEGDATLSIILSKAFLLASDKKITDPTITRQIQHQ